MSQGEASSQGSEIRKRAPARILSIKNIMLAEAKEDGEGSQFFDINKWKVTRVHIIGIIVGKEDRTNYTVFEIDDGTATITARSFEAVNKGEIGDIVSAVGRVREYNKEKYISIEIIKKTSAEWMKVWQKISPEESKEEEKKVDVMEIQEQGKDSFEEMLKMIREKDNGEGVSIDELMEAGINEGEALINSMLKEGEIFENRPGKVKILE